MTQPVELEHKNRVLSEVPHKKDGLKEVLIEQVTQNAASKDTLSLEESKKVYSCPSKVYMWNPMNFDCEIPWNLAKVYMENHELCDLWKFKFVIISHSWWANKWDYHILYFAGHLLWHKHYHGCLSEELALLKRCFILGLVIYFKCWTVVIFCHN